MTLTEQIKTKAKELGFQKVGISPATALAEGALFTEWLARGFHGEMAWLAKNADKRMDPRKVLPEAKSVISLALNYYTKEPSSCDPATGRISRYAWGRDYHEILEEKLELLCEYLRRLCPEAKAKYYVDTGPVMEKAWAQRSGIGWVGKHTNLITREYGSWVFLGEVILDTALEYDEPMFDQCGNCTLCIESCPTEAIVEPYVLDARRCISYLTIELRSGIPEDLQPSMENMIYGCDICQEVCPYNLRSTPSEEPGFAPKEENKRPKLVELLKLTLDQFRSRFRHSPMKRPKWSGFLRNVVIALGNRRAPEAEVALTEALSHPEPQVREHAAQAIKRRKKQEARGKRQEARDQE
jgi:epoxyqueuosine reductase